MSARIAVMPGRSVWALADWKPGPFVALRARAYGLTDASLLRRERRRLPRARPSARRPGGRAGAVLPLPSPDGMEPVGGLPDAEERLAGRLAWSTSRDGPKE
jgi:hypothetical protein